MEGMIRRLDSRFRFSFWNRSASVSNCKARWRYAMSLGTVVLSDSRGRTQARSGRPKNRPAAFAGYLRRDLLAGTYRPFLSAVFGYPNLGVGQRGLGIPDVVDRWVQQAVLQVSEPLELTPCEQSRLSSRPTLSRPLIDEAKRCLARRDSASWSRISAVFRPVNVSRLLN